MSKKDYTKFSNNRNNKKAEEIQNGFVEEPVVEQIPVEEPVVEEVIVAETKRGVITDCAKLNVRSEPSREADVVCIIDATTDLVIYEEESTEDFYKVCTASGAEGFCMKKFIKILP